jgi:hypothetical protein
MVLMLLVRNVPLPLRLQSQGVPCCNQKEPGLTGLPVPWELLRMLVYLPLQPGPVLASQPARLPGEVWRSAG